MHAIVDNYWLTWFPGSLLASFGVFTLLFKGVRTFVRFNDALPTLLSAASELKNNGGSSVKDDVQHIKREQVRVRRELETNRMVTTLRLERIEQKVGIPNEVTLWNSPSG